MTGADGIQRVVLLETLRLAVPLHMDELRQLTLQERAEIARASATVIATHGDDLQFGGRHCRSAFNALARGLAAAALTAQGGANIGGLHFCPYPACRDPFGDHHARFTDVPLPEPEESR